MVAEQGGHDVLMAQAGIYARLFSLQARGYTGGPEERGAGHAGSGHDRLLIAVLAAAAGVFAASAAAKLRSPAAYRSFRASLRETRLVSERWLGQRHRPPRRQRGGRRGEPVRRGGGGRGGRPPAPGCWPRPH